MNSRSQVHDASGQSAASARKSPYIVTNDLAARLGRKEPSWWSTLTVLDQTTAANIDHRLVVDAQGRQWQLRLADWNTPAANRLQFEAGLALALGDELADVPAFIAEDDRLALVYSVRPAQTLADLRQPAVEIRAFLDLATAAADALMRMHAAGIVHGRLAPARLLLGGDGRIRFTGFACTTPTDAGVFADRRIPEADLAYAAPELLRAEPSPADARTDLYAMGVLLYELLAGVPPLTADTLPGWLHAHVAVEAPSALLVRPDVPAVLDRILLKLISKDPGQRYQTARALQADIRRVARSLDATGYAEPFELACGEFAEPARLSRDLFGRHRELKLLADLHAGFRGSSLRRIVLVTGEPGAGKSTLVDAFLADLGSTSAVCASGKGVHIRQGTPFAPMAQALRSALSRLLGGEERPLEAARARLGAVVGCGRVLADLVPDIAILPPETRVLADVPAHLAQARSARIIAETFGALASAEAPLVLFLDDLQWFDQGSLNVVRQLCSEMPPNVFLIASHRADSHSRKAVRDVLDVARGADAFARELVLQPFVERETNALVAFVLKSASDDVRAVSAVVHGQTGGNPFYICQLLQRFLEEESLLFDTDTQRWVWNDDNPGRPREAADLMLDRIGALPPLQRSFLQRCASMGGRCPAAFAAELSSATLEETARAANSLIAAGLLRQSGPDFAIAHDRVLEAAYATMSPAQRMREHLGNARRLATWHPSPHPGLAFEIASQIERADLDALSAGERPLFARFLLMAARKNRAAGEVTRALHFVELIRRIAAGAPPGDLAHLEFEAEWLFCDCLLALARVDEALAAVEDLSKLGRDAVDVADICRLKAIALTLKGAYAAAIDAARTGLRALDLELEDTGDPDALEAIYRRCQQKLDAFSIADLFSLPDMTDRRARSALALLSTLVSSFFVRGDLRFLHVIKVIELTLAYGLAPESAYGLAWFGVLSAHHFGAYETGAAYATAACELATRDGYEAQRTAALIALDQVSAWTRPMRTALGYARDGALVGQAAGDLGMACYARNHIASDMLIIGDRLDLIRAELADSSAMTRDVGYGDIELILNAQTGFVDALVSGENAIRIDVRELNSSSVATRFWVHHYAGLQSFLLGDIPVALHHLEEAEAMAWAAPAHVDTANNTFFLALAHARLPRPERPPAARIELMAVARERFGSWAALNPETFSPKHLLLEAEAARLAEQRVEAMALYERAADAAVKAGFIHDQALAQELAADVYLEANLGAAAQGCLRSAVLCYRQWGAEGKAIRLGERLTASARLDVPAAASGGLQSELDLTAMAAASQTLSEEVGLEQVVRTLMKTMLVHAGAQFALLLLLRDGRPVIEAMARVRSRAIDIELQPAAAPEDLMPASVLKTVLRTARPLTLADAAVEAAQRGLSMGGRHVRSLACIPLIKRGELIGILYMENDLSADVFTPRRMAMIEVIAPQAAISLDAARLYGDLMDENMRRAQAEFQLREARSELARANQMTAMGGFATSIAHEINQPLATVVAHADAGLRWLNRAEPDLAEVASSLQNIRQAGRRAADIITALRSLVKLSPSTLSPVLIEDIVDDVLKIAAPDLSAGHVDLTVDFGAGRNMIMADNIQLQQVFFNIVSNAIQAMSNVEPSLRRLRITSSVLQGEVEVAIEDAGCGMSQQVVSRIFQPFFTTKKSGMGVGLAICRSIIELHDGTLEARSVEGQGSTFVVRLPIARA